MYTRVIGASVVIAGTILLATALAYQTSRSSPSTGDTLPGIPAHALYPENPRPIPEAARHITGAFVPSKRSYMAFEPIDISFIVENASDSEYAFPVGGAQRMTLGANHNFFVHITDVDGYDMPLFLYHRGGLVGQRKVPAAGRHEETMLLNAWVDLIEPGAYTVTMRRELYGTPITGNASGVTMDLPATSWRLRVPPGLEVDDSRLRRLMVQSVRHSNQTYSIEEAVERVDWMLRMPMIESTFEIEILPFEPESFLEIVAARPREEFGAVLADGGCSNAIAVIAVQLDLLREPSETLSKALVLDALQAGRVPGPRPDHGETGHWVRESIKAYETLNAPHPYPIRAEDMKRDIAAR